MSCFQLNFFLHSVLNKCTNIDGVLFYLKVGLLRTKGEQAVEETNYAYTLKDGLTFFSDLFTTDVLFFLLILYSLAMCTLNLFSVIL